MVIVLSDKDAWRPVAEPDLLIPFEGVPDPLPDCVAFPSSTLEALAAKLSEQRVSPAFVEAGEQLTNMRTCIQTNQLSMNA
eukprot:scaffold9785_cov43-Prasinocladus_malaysianus.AAC.1